MQRNGLFTSRNGFQTNSMRRIGDIINDIIAQINISIHRDFESRKSVCLSSIYAVQSALKLVAVRLLFACYPFLDRADLFY